MSKRMMSRTGRIKRWFCRGRCGWLMVVLALTTSGCADIKPWVKPYERDRLADPIMSLSRHGSADSYMHHVYQAREASRGAEGGAGGGCGCN